ncbi:MAG TPA: amino acid--tRNA ligase-related protein, partial [Polyangiaceae bacterium]|nr:amino acid--tRNA ligase-related protein [Polyangiaceae bacterium]
PEPLGPLRERFNGARLENGKYDPARVGEFAAAAGEVRVAGRIIFLRDLGQVRFLRLRDRTGEMQLLALPGAPDAVARAFDDLDIGDVVEARGAPAVSRTGELSIELKGLRLLTKALRPVPTRFGLADVEQRYRQRYVDLVVSPGAAAAFRARSLLVRELRRFLDDEGFLEVETPTLNTLVGGALAKPFQTHHNVLDLSLSLRVAPELYLKRLVVGGFERVYEIGRCYRNEGVSTRHNPEFTMLEFYEAYATYETIMARTEALLRAADRGLARAMPAEHAGWAAARPFTLDEPFRRLPMADAVGAALERAKLPAEVPAAVRGSDPAIKAWAGAGERAKKRIDWGGYRKAALACENEGEALFCAYEYLAEPFLGEDYRSAAGDKSVPVFVTDHPVEVSPLARRKDDPARRHLVDRFELFVHGRELCNAFSELNDPDDQAARFREQAAKRAKGAEETMDYDADYVRALEHGMPPAAGFGMGVDRLAMALTNQASIRDVILFPLLRPEAGA